MGDRGRRYGINDSRFFIREKLKLPSGNRPVYVSGAMAMGDDRFSKFSLTDLLTYLITYLLIGERI